MRITRQFKTLDGQPLDLDHLKQNTVFVLLLEGRAEDGQPHRAMLQHGLPAGWEIAGRLDGGDVPGMAWLGKLSETEAQPAADDRYAAVVALTPEQPDFRLAVRVRAVTPGTYRAARGRGGRHVSPRGVRPPERRADHASLASRSEPCTNLVPLCAAEAVRLRCGRDPAALLCAALAPARHLLRCSDWLFPPDLSRLASVGTEVLDRQDRPLALLPAPGGVWRFRAGTAPHAAHQSADRGRGPPLLVPPRRRSARPGPRHRAVAARPATSSPAARRWRCRPPACSSRDRARSAPS